MTLKREYTYDSRKRIHPYDGYQSETVFKEKENYSTYYDAEIENQCCAPLKSLAKIQEDLEAEWIQKENSAEQDKAIKKLNKKFSTFCKY